MSIQILWVNVIAETIIGSALTAEPSCRDVMDRQPYAKDAPLVDGILTRQIVKGGMLIGLATLGIFSGAMLLGLELAKARTLAFATLIFSQLVYAYQCRSNRKQKPGKYMNLALLSSSALLLGAIYIPPRSGHSSGRCRLPRRMSGLCVSQAISIKSGSPVRR